MSGTIVYGNIEPDISMITDLQRQICETVLNVWVNLALGCFGMVTNTLVLAVFVRQGIKDSVSISLAAMAVLELIACSSSVVYRLYGLIRLVDQILGTNWDNVSVLTFSVINVNATTTTNLVAAYIALERCICVTYPLAVKLFFTTTTHSGRYMHTMYPCLFSLTMVRASYNFAPVESWAYNQTVIGYIPSEFLLKNLDYLHALFDFMYFLWPSLSFTVMKVCSTIIIVKLRESSKFRVQTTKRIDSQRTLSKRDTQVTKMLVVVVLTCLVSVIPKLTANIYKWLDARFFNRRGLHNALWTLGYVMFTLSGITACVNFFIYLKMNSKFRDTFTTFLAKSKTEK